MSLSRPIAVTAAAPKSPIQAIDRSVALLEVVAAAGPAGISLSQATARVGVHQSTGRTLMSALAIHGLLAQIESNRRYVLGARFFELNRTYILQNDLGAVAAPILRGLWEETRETVQLATLQHGRRVDVSVLVSPQLLNVNPSATPAATSALDPLLHTAAGKVLLEGLDEDARERLLAEAPEDVDTAAALAEIERVHAAGYATNFEEEEAGVCGIAAPVRDHSGRVIAAICIAYPSVRHSPDHDADLVARVVSAAVALSALLGAGDAGGSA